MIYGVALISVCMFGGFLIGDLIGSLTGIDSNVGGVGFAMLTLIIITSKMQSKKRLTTEISEGIMFWQSMYIPVVIAMTSVQDVVSAMDSGAVAFIAGIAVVVIGFVIVWAMGRLSDCNKRNMCERRCGH